LNANLIYSDVTDRFLDKLAGVADPEEKRVIIGGELSVSLKKRHANWMASTS
jgi:GMP synthase, PP-ATPase domain/subunit